MDVSRWKLTVGQMEFLSKDRSRRIALLVHDGRRWTLAYPEKLRLPLRESLEHVVEDIEKFERLGAFKTANT